MLIKKLEKPVVLYKEQYDRLAVNLFGSNLINRLSMEMDGIIFKTRYMLKNNLDIDKIPEMNDIFGDKVIQMRKCVTTMLQELLVIAGTDMSTVEDVFINDMKVDPIYVKLDLVVLSNSDETLNNIDTNIPEDTPWNIFPDKYFRFGTESYNDGVAKAFPELFEQKHLDIGTGNDGDVFVHSVTLQTTESCNLNCTYCFAAGTKILMSDYSEKNIEDVEVGDEVLAFDENDRINGRRLLESTVVATMSREDVCYEISHWGLDRPLFVTGEHPILTLERGWVQVRDLKPSDGLRVFKGRRKRDWLYGKHGLYNYEIEKMSETVPVYNLETTAHTYFANKVAVHNCYQHSKTPMRMSFETAKKFIDGLLESKYDYVNQYNSPAVILEFIGGEPLIEIKLTRKIYEYFLKRAYELNHPWFTMHRLSLCSNGLAYFDKDVQSFFKDYSSQISFNISIDGNKELHDACRIQPNAEGSYDIAMMALDHYNKNYTPERNSKMTLSPQNIKYLFDSVKDFIDKGMRVININCVFEEGWTPKEANVEYTQLIKLADYLLENDLEHLYIAIFNERQEAPLPASNNSCFCFRGDILVSTPSGSRKISDLMIDDEVYSASSTINRVTQMHSYYSDDNVQMIVNGVFPIRCTSTHKVLARKIEVINKKAELGAPAFYPVSELRRGDRVALPKLRLRGKYFKQSIYMTSGMARAIALYLQHGYVADNGDVIIRLKRDTDDRSRYILEYAMLKIQVKKTNGGITYRIPKSISSEKHELYNRFYSKVCKSCGVNEFNKHIPQIVMKSPRSIIKDLMNELCYFNRNNGRNVLTYKSSKLANDVALLLRSFGKYTTCNQRIKDGIDVYEINLKRNDLFIEDEMMDVLWSEVQLITKDEPYQVFCPTLEHEVYDEHTFIANGIAVENCGGNGSMLAMRPNGQFYPCLRYMPTSVGTDVKDLSIGDVNTGIIGRSEGSEVLVMLDSITRRSQNTDVCYECPIANSCASCLALGHTVFGDPGKRTTFICVMVIAQALANVYYWNMLALKHPEWDMPIRRNMVPDEWALLIIDEEELEKLKFIECKAMEQKLMNE